MLCMQNIGGKQFSDENSWARSSATHAPYMDETVSCFSFRGTIAWGFCSCGMLVVVYHFRDSLSVPSLHMELIGCPETSVNKCQLASRNVSEERRPHLNDCRSMKSLTDFFVRHTHEQKFSSAALVEKKKNYLWLLSCRKPLCDGIREQKKTDVCPRIAQDFQKCGSDLSISYVM